MLIRLQSLNAMITLSVSHDFVRFLFGCMWPLLREIVYTHSFIITIMFVIRMKMSDLKNNLSYYYLL